MKNLASLLSITSLAITGVFFITMAQPVAASASEAQANDAKTGQKRITDRRHPDYVRCRKEPVIGSLARTRKICMTNEKWAEYSRKGNAEARQFVDGTAVGTSDSRFPIAPLDSSRP